MRSPKSLEATRLLEERVAERAGQREDAADAPRPLGEGDEGLAEVGVAAIDASAFVLVVGDVVDGELHRLAVADEEDARVADVGGAQLGGAALLEEGADDGGGAALGATDAALAEGGEETFGGLDELVVRLDARLGERLEAEISLGPLLHDELGEVLLEPLGHGEAAVAVEDAVDGVGGTGGGVGVHLLGGEGEVAGRVRRGVTGARARESSVRGARAGSR